MHLWQQLWNFESFTFKKTGELERGKNVKLNFEPNEFVFRMVVTTRGKIPYFDPEAFFNVELQKQITYTLSTDKRIMSFVDSMWGIEVSGGVDQFEPLTIINVTPTGMAKRAGMRIGDEIIQINYTPAEDLTFNEALELFRKTGKHVRVYVRG